MKKQKTKSPIFDEKGKLRKGFKYIPCKLCGGDVKVVNEAIGATCYLCLMQQSDMIDKKSDQSIVSLIDIGSLVEQLEIGNLTKLRNQLVYTQEIMAKKLGISQQAYSRYEKENKISQKTLDKVLRRLKLEYNKQYAK